MTAEELKEPAVEVEVRVRASPEAVFAFFTEPERYVRWQGVRAELDPRPGGLYRVVMDESNTARGEYLEVRPPHRVVFTWGWEGSEDLPPGSSTVEIDLVPDGEATVVHVRHTGLPDEGQRVLHRRGWDLYLAQLGEEVG